MRFHPCTGLLPLGKQKAEGAAPWAAGWARLATEVGEEKSWLFRAFRRRHQIS